MSEELVAIAKVAKPRGLKGEVVADLLTDFPERFENTETVRALFADGQSRDLKIEEFWFQK
ncbi:MAG: 16S rRNA processing protein RimM, partial [Acidobacteriota bacterium]